MKKSLILLLAGILTLSLFSCGESKKSDDKKENKCETLEDLEDKYIGKDFKDCDEFIKAAEEMLKVYYITIDKAVDGDKEAELDVNEFNDFFLYFQNTAEEFESKCPEQFDIFHNKHYTKTDEYIDKLIWLKSDENKYEDYELYNMPGSTEGIYDMSDEEWIETEGELEEELLH